MFNDDATHGAGFSNTFKILLKHIRLDNEEKCLCSRKYTCYTNFVFDDLEKKMFKKNRQ